MFNQDSFEYAVENTHVLHAPENRIETFGNTRFRYYLITELMDRVNEVRVRDGYIHAERPQIITPGSFAKVLLEGFEEQGQEFGQWLEQHVENFAILKYGFQFRKTGMVENTIQSNVEDVVKRIQSTREFAEEPLSAIIQGVDDAWEICLLKFTMDLISKSAPGNMGDFRKRGLI